MSNRMTGLESKFAFLQSVFFYIKVVGFVNSEVVLKVLGHSVNVPFCQSAISSSSTHKYVRYNEKLRDNLAA
jgi:hypothetical protein